MSHAVLHNRTSRVVIAPDSLLYTTMWKQILTKVNTALLAHWSQLVWFVLGVVLGVFVLGGLVSCTAVQPAWDGTKEITSTVADTVEGTVSGVYQGVKSAVVSGVEAAEGVVEGTYELVTDPFVGGTKDE